MSELVQEAAATEAPNETPVEQKPEAKSPESDEWKAKAREWEKRAKANADAAKRLQEIEDAQKSAEQKAAEHAAKVARDLEEARSEALRYKAAATHRVSEDNFDLLGTGSEEVITGRAQRIGAFEAALAERDQLRAELEALKGATSTPRPVDQLKPGAPASAVDDSYPASWFPQARKPS